MLRTLMNRYATPLTTGLFLVSLISGVAIFFHVGEAYFHNMHVWLSMVLILPFVFHVVKNWRSLLSYFGRGWLMWPLAASLVAAVAFVVPTVMSPQSGGGLNPGSVARVLTGAAIKDLAPLFRKTPDEVVAALKAKGFDAATPDATLGGIAAKAGKEGREALGVLFALK